MTCSGYIACLAFVVATTAGGVDLRRGGPNEDLRRGPTFRLFFPPLELRGELVRLFVNVKCGEFGGVVSNPADWYFATQRSFASSIESELEAYAGHGATYLWSMREWNGSILVSIVDPECFTVSATVVTEGTSDTPPREIKLARSQLKLRK